MSFFKTKIDYLGFEISQDGIAPGKLKTNCIVNFPRPNDIKSLRGFIGLASYFRRFVKGFAMIIKPITDLLKKGNKFEWSNSQEDAFNKIKIILCTQPILRLYNPTAKTELHTDACQSGLSGMLYQV